MLDDKLEYKNSKIEIKKSKDLRRVIKDLGKASGGKEFIEMFKNGIDSTFESVTKENTMLRNCLLDLQTELSQFVENYAERKLKLITIDPNGFKILTGNNVKDIQDIFTENIKRLTSFLYKVIDPSHIYGFIDKLKSDPRVENKLGSVERLDDLYELVIYCLLSCDSSRKTFKESENEGEGEIENTHDEDRATAKFSTCIDDETDQDACIYINNLSTSNKDKLPSEETKNQTEDNFKKKKVEVERKKWENLISNNANTFFFQSEESDEE